MDLLSTGTDPIANHLNHYKHVLQGIREPVTPESKAVLGRWRWIWFLSLSFRHLSTTWESRSRRTSPSSCLMSFVLATISFHFFSYFTLHSRFVPCNNFWAPHSLLICHIINTESMWLLTIEMHQTSACCCFGFFVVNMDGLDGLDWIWTVMEFSNGN